MSGPVTDDSRRWKFILASLGVGVGLAGVWTWLWFTSKRSRSAVGADSIATVDPIDFESAVEWLRWYALSQPRAR